MTSIPNTTVAGGSGGPELDNTLRIFNQFDTDMLEFHLQGTDKGRAEAEKITKLLHGYPQLPLVFRARACMILGSADEPGYFEWAKEAVRITQLGIDAALAAKEDPPGDLGEEYKLLECAKEVLEKAEKGFEELGGYEEGDDDVEVQDEEAVVDEKVTAADEM